VGAVVNRFILLGFLLLMSIDTASQVCIKLAGNRIGPFEFDATWLARATAEPLIYLVLLSFGCSFVVYITLLKYAPVGPAYAAAHGHIVGVLMVSILVFGERLSLMQALGATAIIAGVTILAATEGRANEAALELANGRRKREPRRSLPDM
jgi:multidrug transporter EmrE-like cation transporter